MPNEPLDALRKRGPEANSAFELPTTATEQIVADVPRPALIVSRTRIVGATPRGDRATRQSDGGRRDCRLRHRRAPGHPFDGVTIAIACVERHRLIHSRRVRAQYGFGGAHRLDEFGPGEAGYRAKAGDAVRHHELCQRETLHGALHGLLDAHRVFGDPLLEPEERREIRARRANLLEEPREKSWGELRRIGHERGQLTGESRTVSYTH